MMLVPRFWYRKNLWEGFDCDMFLLSSLLMFDCYMFFLFVVCCLPRSSGYIFLAASWAVSPMWPPPRMPVTRRGPHPRYDWLYTFLLLSVSLWCTNTTHFIKQSCWDCPCNSALYVGYRCWYHWSSFWTKYCHALKSCQPNYIDLYRLYMCILHKYIPLSSSSPYYLEPGV